MTRVAAEDSRRLSLPQKAEEYKIGTTEAFKAPQGVDFKIDMADPLWTQAQSWAHKNGLSQQAFNEGIDLLAGSRVGDAATVQAAHTAEIAKLGANGPARVTALETFFTGLAGADAAKQIKDMAVTANLVMALEKVAAKFASQGIATFSQAHREPGQAGGKVSDDAYRAMSPAQRLDYARQFDQTQFQKAG